MIGAGPATPGSGWSVECRDRARRPDSPQSAMGSLVGESAGALECRPRRSTGEDGGAVGSPTLGPRCDFSLSRDGPLSYAHGADPALSAGPEFQLLPGAPGGDHWPSELTGCQAGGSGGRGASAGGGQGIRGFCGDGSGCGCCGGGGANCCSDRGGASARRCERRDGCGSNRSGPVVGDAVGASHPPGWGCRSGCGQLWPSCGRSAAGAGAGGAAQASD
jgi:hypothetical protein